MKNTIDLIRPSLREQLDLLDLLQSPPESPLDANDDESRYHVDLLLHDFNTGPGVIPFVGAGLSIPFGAPGWGDFLLRLAKEIDLEEEVHERLNPDKGDYEGAAELLVKEMGRDMFENALQREFLMQIRRAKPGVQTVELLPHLPPGPVITTNFDRILEAVFQFAGEQFEPPVWGGRAGAFSLALRSKDRSLLKIHGDVVDRMDRILTTSDYKRQYGSTSAKRVKNTLPLPHVLHDVFKTRPLLFLGCSLANDRTMTLLERAAAEEGGVMHYTIMPRPKPRANEVDLKKRLFRKKIRPIWVEDYDAVRTLLAHIVGQLPASSRLGQLIEAERDQDLKKVHNLGETLIRHKALLPLSSLLTGQALIKQAVVCLQNGCVPDAVFYARLAHDQERLPPNPVSAFILAFMCFLNGEDEEALKFAQQAARTAGPKLDWFNPDEGAEREADEVLARELIQAPFRDKDSHIGYMIDPFCSFLYFLKGDIDASLKHSDRVLAFHADNEDVSSFVRPMRIGALAAEGNFDDALTEAKEYLKRHPDGFFFEEIQEFVHTLEHGNWFERAATQILVYFGGQAVRLWLKEIVQRAVLRRLLAFFGTADEQQENKAMPMPTNRLLEHGKD